MKISAIQTVRPIIKNTVNQQKQVFKGNDIPNNNPFSKSISFDKEIYKQKFLDKLKEHQDEIYDYLDKAEITFNNKTAPIMEHISSLFDNKFEQYYKETIFHNSEQYEKILTQGFDFSKIKNTVFGPGMYFSADTDNIGMYRGKTIQADFEGKISNGENLKEYNKLNNEIEKAIRHYLGIENYFSETTMSEHEVMQKFIDEYSRKQIVEKLGLDGAYCNEGQYFVVFNPDSISNICLKN